MKHGVLTLLVVILAGCAATDSTVVPDAQMSLGIANGTTIEVKLVVNGSEVRAIPALTDAEVPASALPGLPWQASLTTAAGRVLVALDVKSGDVHRSSGSHSGVGRRADLSCGRLDLYSGPPMLGPMPGPGAPGDCD